MNINGAPVDSAILQSMTDILAHRGPDGEGIFVSGPVGLGHRRLAILDPGPNGQQPFQSEDGRFTLTYNGELYNYKEIRSELEGRGQTFKTNCDTEVMLYALAHWGENALEKFNGMFAFGFWDEKEKTLLLGRDRFGVKPVYYAFRNNCFLFGSEVKAILQHPDLRAEMDPEALLEYMTFQNFFTDKTLFRNITLLPAGSFLRLESGKAPEIKQYWDYRFEEDHTLKSEEEYIEELDFLFQQAVKRQLISDVPVSAYLSGGMDSGSITSIASKYINPLRTFTVGFDMHSISGLELGFDERERAEYMSYLFSTEHYEMVLKAGDMERCMEKVVWHLEEPRVGQSYPNYYAAGLASKFAKVVLAGTGGDELFGGYPWRYYQAVVNDDPYEYINKYYKYWQRLIPNRDIQKVFQPIRDQVQGVWTLDLFGHVIKPHLGNDIVTPESYVNHSLYLEAKTFLHGLFVVEDKLSMAHSLENRVPFMDNDLVDFAMKLPVQYKLGNLGEVVRINENEPGKKTRQYFSKTNDGKLLLRKTMQSHIPDKVTKNIKQGFSAPDNSWFKGESIDYVRDKIMGSNAKFYDYMDRESLQALVQEHLDGTTNRRLLIWSLLYLEEFCETFLGKKVSV